MDRFNDDGVAGRCDACRKMKPVDQLDSCDRCERVNLCAECEDPFFHTCLPWCE